ncbi:hypothetical protein JCM10450v2_000297 [Rhodotorula kratochvilovae]
MPSDNALRAELDRAVQNAQDTGVKAVPVRLVLDDRPTEYTTPFLRHKTTLREVYDSARARHGATLSASASPTAPPFDVLLFNPAGQVTESSISNVAFRLQGGRDTSWVTPAASCGLLEGVMRAEMLERGQIVEGVVTVEEVREAAKRGTLEILCFNGVRGSFKACLAPARQAAE